MTFSVRARKAAVAGPSVLWWALLFGCQHVVNPYMDQTTPADDITTATAETVSRNARPAPEGTETKRSGWPTVTAVGHGGSVSHWPLWFEDRYEDQGSEDGRFAVTAEDYWAWPYSVVKWMVNLLGLPASAVVTPPFTIMTSDGVLSHQIPGFWHDAEKGPGQAKDVGEADSLVLRGADDLQSDQPLEDATSE
jgi:hypothetical protein